MGLVGLFTLQISLEFSLWRTDCCRRAQVAAVIPWSVCPSLHRSPQQWRCLRCPRGPSRTSLMGLPGPITLGT